MNSIYATILGHRVAILSRSICFGARHVAQGTTVELFTKDDGGNLVPYVPVGRHEWEDTIDQQGKPVSDRGGNFRLRDPQILGADVALFSPCDPGRLFPDEVIEPAVSVKVDETVIIHGNLSPTPYQATVKEIDEQSFLIRVGTTFANGESGAIVTDMKEHFVGFVSTPGGGISVPNLGPLVGTTPAPRPPQPPTTPTAPPTQEDLDRAVTAARAEERAKMRLKLLGIADSFI